jgi:hypothetical protein
VAPERPVLPQLVLEVGSRVHGKRLSCDY